MYSSWNTASGTNADSTARAVSGKRGEEGDGVKYRPLHEDEQPSAFASWTRLEKVPLSLDDPARFEPLALTGVLTVKLPASAADVLPGEPEPAL